MGVIQQSINSALSSVTQTAAISKAATELSKKNELEKLNAESEYLKNKSEIQKEIGELDKFKEESKIASEKANQELESANKGVSGAEDIVGMLPNDPEARKILRESQEKADLAKATAEARKREKLNKSHTVSLC